MVTGSGIGDIGGRSLEPPEAVAGRPVAGSSLWEYLAAQSRQARPEEAQGGELGHCQGGHFDHAAWQQARYHLGTAAQRLHSQRQRQPATLDAARSST